MFWGSVIEGLKILTFWEVYVAGLEYLAIFVIPMILVGLATEKGENTAGSYIGCLSMILMPVFQAAAMAVMILTIAPIIFGFSNDAAWSFPWQLITMAPGAFLKLVGVLIVAAIVVAFVPILGRLHSLHTLVLGGIALSFVLSILESANPGTVSGRVDLIPSFWFSFGLIVIGGIMSWAGIMVVGVVVTAMDMADEGLAQQIMFPIGAIFGFIPVFMYGAWLGAQVRGGF